VEAENDEYSRLFFIFGIIVVMPSVIWIQTFHVISMAAARMNLNQDLVNIQVRLFAIRLRSRQKC